MHTRLMWVLVVIAFLSFASPGWGMLPEEEFVGVLADSDGEKRLLNWFEAADQKPGGFESGVRERLVMRKLLPADQAEADILVKKHLEFYRAYVLLLKNRQIPKTDVFEKLAKDDKSPGLERSLAGIITYVSTGNEAQAVEALKQNPANMFFFAKIVDPSFGKILQSLMADAAREQITFKFDPAYPQVDPMVMPGSRALGTAFVEILQAAEKQKLPPAVTESVIAMYGDLWQGHSGILDPFHMVITVREKMGQRTGMHLLRSLCRQGLSQVVFRTAEMNPEVARTIIDELNDVKAEMEEDATTMKNVIDKLKADK